jgi:hypothetical protein
MHLITQAISQIPESLKSISIPVDRHKLARRAGVARRPMVPTSGLM